MKQIKNNLEVKAEKALFKNVIAKMNKMQININLLSKVRYSKVQTPMDKEINNSNNQLYMI